MRELEASPRGRVSVGLPPRVAEVLTVRLVQRFRSRFPRAVVAVTEGLSLHLHEWLVAGRLDLALLVDPPSSPHLSYETLEHEALQLVGPRTGKRLPARLSVAGLARYPLVLPAAPNAIRSLVDAAVRPRGVRLTIVAEVGAVQTALALVASGAGCSFVPEAAVAAAASRHAFQVADIVAPALSNSLVLAVPHAGPANRLTRETAAILRSPGFRRQIRPGR